MRAARIENTLALTFSLFERRLLQHILKQIMANYQTKPDRLDPKAAAVWYSTQGCRSAKMSAEDTLEWLENLRHYRSANVQHLAKWSRGLAVPEAAECQLRVELEHISILLTALNDHRLLLAAQHDIGQKEMDIRSLSGLSKLPPKQLTALCEMQFLAGIIGAVLHFLPGDPGGWMEVV